MQNADYHQHGEKDINDSIGNRKLPNLTENRQTNNCK
jgi:hypothetical protein